MDAGAMDRRVALLRAGTVTDDYGDEVDGFAPLATVWGSVKPSPGTERLASAENAATAPTVITIRYSRKVADLNPRDRVEYPVGSGRQFDIKSVVEIGRREGLQIAAIGRADG
ncbi:phage head closure protein [Sphingomonas parapaucimobilis]|uniref:phage head closure protein n=1 Tax=Sphingomonas parapaucimobilis TaxID=28213 RepID=UPI00321B017E